MNLLNNIKDKVKALVPVKKTKQIQVPGKYKDDSLIQMAINKDLDIEKLRELIALKKEEEERQAQKDFDFHFAEMQKEFEPIGKTEQGYEFKYAPLGFMIEKYGPVIAKHGFSFRWKEEKIETGKRVYIIISGWGHTDQNTSFDVPIITPTKRQNEIQVKGTMSSYGERYTFKAGFGIVEMNEDSDGNLEKKEPEIIYTLRDTYENRQLYYYAIKELLRSECFTETERNSFVESYKKGEIKTIENYKNIYISCIQIKKKRNGKKDTEEYEGTY